MRNLLNTFERVGELKRMPSGLSSLSMADALFIKVAELITADRSSNYSNIFDWMVIKALAHSILGNWMPEAIGLLGEKKWRDIARLAVVQNLQECPRNLQQHYIRRFDELWELDSLDTLPVKTDRNRWAFTLCKTARGGYAAVGKPKCFLYPRESQGDHSLMCAVYSALLATDREVDISRPCLMAFFHHLPTVLIPDIDHEIEHIIGLAEKDLIESRAQSILLRDFPKGLQNDVAAAMSEYRQGGEDKARMIALEADILDRMLQVRYYERAWSVNASRAIEEYELLNQEPLESFQRGILRGYGLY
jgi:5'-deoxynucleotidase YfbR-like HD superfamily hydrolase